MPSDSPHLGTAISREFSAPKSTGTNVPQRPLASRLWYNVLWCVCRLAAVVLFRYRATGREHLPREGGVLVCSNHQSHLDPVLVGLTLDRRLNYLARDTLFGFAPFRWLIQSLDAIPIDREGLGLAGLKETLRRLKRGEMVLLFPEGRRTDDGRVAPFKAGFLSLVRRSHAALLPVAIDGAFATWPRHQLLPWPAAIHVHVGEPISPDAAAEMSDEELMSELERRIHDAFQRARQDVAA